MCGVAPIKAERQRVIGDADLRSGEADRIHIYLKRANGARTTAGREETLGLCTKP